MGFPRALEQTYEVLDAIGCGGFARVFRVRHRDLDRVMALKLMPVFGPDQRDEQKRCRREITTLARLSHPGLVRILDVGEAEGHLYYTMELYPGPDLGTTLRTHQTLPPGRICDIGIQVARALGHIHREGVVHRDIKPENILFDAREGAILADFGLAHVTDVTAMTKESEILGTPLYLSPEQINGDRVSPATDIYQLGVVLFKAASGKVPFGEQGFAQLCEAIVRQPPPRPTTFRADLPRPLEAVILRCLEKDPARRWPSAAALEEALRSAAKGLFTPTPTAGRPADPGPAPASGPEASPPEKGPDGEGRMGLSIVLGFVVGSLVMIACWAFIGRVPRHQALVGQTTVVVAFDGPIAEQPAVTLRTAGGGAPLAPSRIEGASVRFDRLTTDTRYLLEWRRSWGTTAGEELRTLPDLGSTLAVEL
ncbi:MAG: serine/threonine protein kinase, partial [Candidatus Riflebacteria bacterium]|nr:serine/threonine protein kinase [Candidatus Riflebacteria bacterium]